MIQETFEKRKKIIFSIIGAVIILEYCLFLPKILHLQKKNVYQVPGPTFVPVPSKITNIIDNVNKKITMPSDEIPNVATVTDVAKLHSQIFFSNAQNGDKVLMYLTAKKAVLYRPSTDQIIQVSPLDVLNQGASDSAEATQSADLRVTY